MRHGATRAYTHSPTRRRRVSPFLIVGPHLGAASSMRAGRFVPDPAAFEESGPVERGTEAMIVRRHMPPLTKQVAASSLFEFLTDPLRRRCGRSLDRDDPRPPADNYRRRPSPRW